MARPDGPGSSSLRSPEPQGVSAHAGNDPSRDDDPYWDYDDGECWNCGGEGYVYGCSWDWQCSTYDQGEGTCLCTRPCHVCHPPKSDPALRQVLADALASGIEAATAGETGTGSTEGESPAPSGETPESTPL